MTHERILIVDDSRATLEILRIQLEKHGYETATAENGKIALERVEEFQPHVVLCDVMMPVMDGMAFCERMKQDKDLRFIPIIILTARGDTSYIIKGLSNGADDYVVKPYNLGELLARIGVMLRMRNLQEELKNAQMQLIQTAKMAAVGQLGAGIAHELNQPLTGIKGYATLIKRGLPEVFNDEPLHEYLDIIFAQADRMAKIIQNIRAFSHQGDYIFQMEQIRRPIEDALMLVSKQIELDDIRLVIDIADDLPALPLDPLKFQQVILNLLQNAMDALSDCRGEKVIAITARRSVDRPDLELLCIVSDNGEGISAKALKNLFVPFFTTKEPGKGTGLGLSISKGIVEEHKGRIQVSSSPKQGTSITIHLPIKMIEDRQG